jgi:hypothetical protein
MCWYGGCVYNNGVGNGGAGDQTTAEWLAMVLWLLYGLARAENWIVLNVVETVECGCYCLLKAFPFCTVKPNRFDDSVEERKTMALETAAQAIKRRRNG